MLNKKTKFSKNLASKLFCQSIPNESLKEKLRICRAVCLRKLLRNEESAKHKQNNVI